MRAYASSCCTRTSECCSGQFRHRGHIGRGDFPKIYQWRMGNAHHCYSPKDGIIVICVNTNAVLTICMSLSGIFQSKTRPEYLSEFKCLCTPTLLWLPHLGLCQLLATSRRKGGRGLDSHGCAKICMGSICHFPATVSTTKLC